MVNAPVSSPVPSGPKPRMRHVCRGMSPDERAAYFGPDGYGRKLFGDREADNQLREIERRRQGKNSGIPRSITDYCRQRGMESPRDRLRFCESGDALKVFPSEQVDAEIAKLTKERTRIRNVVCSYSWYVSAWRDREEYPPGRDDTGMVLAKGKVRWGHDNPVSRRWTPAIAAKVEDELDNCPHPSETGAYPLAMKIADLYGSPSAQAIITLRTYKVSPHNKAEVAGLRDSGGRVGRKKSQAGRKAREENQ